MVTSQRHFLIAMAPAALIGIAGLGERIADLPIDAAVIWQLALVNGLGIGTAEPHGAGAFAIGAAFWLPLFAVALAVSRFWAAIFARLRSRPLDSGWLLHALVFSLLIPATMPLAGSALALSFGLVFGCHIFGGSGRYLVHPALLGVVFIALAYPTLVDATAWLPGAVTASTWSIAAGGVEALAASGTSLMDVFIGREVGAIGTTSAAACLVGVLYLIAVRQASVAIVFGGVIAMVIAGVFFGELPWIWHLALGNFAFVLAFIATDPTISPQHVSGRFVFGALIGLLTIVLRVGDPAHPEGAWAALLLASLVVPLIDHLTHRTEHNRMSQAASGALE